MDNGVLIKLLDPAVIAELTAVILTGWVAWLIQRQLRRRIEGDGYRAATVKNITLGVLVGFSFPLAWGAGLWLAALAPSTRFQPVALIENAIGSLSFVFLYQALAVGIRFALPTKRFTNIMLRFAVAFGLAVLALRFVGWYDEGKALFDFTLIQIGPASISLGVIAKSVFFAWILFLGAAQITAFLQNRILSRTDIDPNLSFATMRFLKFFLFGVGLFIVLDTAGVNLSALTVFGGALGIGLGFGLQNIASNLVSGILLLLDRSIKQGDVISVGESYGWVVRLGARYIVVRTRDGVEKLIPNANLIASEITNWSHSDRAVRIHIKVGVAYASDPFKVRDLLLRVVENNPRVLKKPAPNVLFIDFGDSSLIFELRVWINDPEGGIEAVRSAVRFEIWKIFKDNGIEIPFPQRDLHIRSGLLRQEWAEAADPSIEIPADPAKRQD